MAQGSRSSLHLTQPELCVNLTGLTHVLTDRRHACALTIKDPILKIRINTSLSVESMSAPPRLKAPLPEIRVTRPCCMHADLEGRGPCPPSCCQAASRAGWIVLGSTSIKLSSPPCYGLVIRVNTQNLAILTMFKCTAEWH